MLMFTILCILQFEVDDSGSQSFFIPEDDVSDVVLGAGIAVALAALLLVSCCMICK